MKYTLFAVAFCLLFASLAFGQDDEINVVPKPRNVVEDKGHFLLRKDTKILVLNDGSMHSAETLNEFFRKAYGFKLKIIDKSNERTNFLKYRNVIVLLPVAIDSSGGTKEEIKREKYSLTIRSEAIYIGGTGAGQFYGFQTLQQLLPIQFKKEAKIPLTQIVDAPRFPYRGMHLDV